MANFLDTLFSKLLISDAPIITAIRNDLASITPTEQLCVDYPNEIQEAHAIYLRAGASVIRTQSFQANGWQLKKFGLEKNINQINWKAGKLASGAIGDAENIWQAGRVGPIGTPLSELKHQGFDPLSLFIEQIGPLLDGGSDFILFEHFSNVEELAIAVEALRNLHHCPAVACLEWDGQTGLDKSFDFLRDVGADAVGVNIEASPRLPEDILKHITVSSHSPFAVFLSKSTKDEIYLPRLVDKLRGCGVSLLGFNDGYTVADVKSVCQPEQ